MFYSSGIIRYSQHYGNFKLIVEVDKQLADYYRALVPKEINLNHQRYLPHISVVRNEKPPYAYEVHWGKYDKQSIEFKYSHYVYNDETYYWLNAFSTRLEDIRIELGLPASSIYTRPPSGFQRCFHITIGNTKGKETYDL